MQSSVPAGSSSIVTGTSSGGHFLGGQPQAAIMKQMLIEQRAQLHVMEQQKQQFLREQRQQQQQQILAEQVQYPSVSSAGWDEREHYRQCSTFLLELGILSMWVCQGISAMVVKEEATVSVLPLAWQILLMFPMVGLIVTGKVSS